MLHDLMYIQTQNMLNMETEENGGHEGQGHEEGTKDAKFQS